MNINQAVIKPVMFTELKSSYALCYIDGTIHQIFTKLDSAKYMLQTYGLGANIYEVVCNKKLIIMIGEVI